MCIRDRSKGSLHGRERSAHRALAPQLQQLLLQLAFDLAQLGFGFSALRRALLLDRQHLVQRGDQLLVGVLQRLNEMCIRDSTNIYKEGSIGLPFPDTYIKIVRPDTDEEVPYGEEGEILLAGPTVMQEYMNNPEETAHTLRKHADGLTWVYTCLLYTSRCV